MLRSMKEMESYAIGATDGVMGQVKDFYFDDESWVVRYLIVETGAWLSRRKVLISPIAIAAPNAAEKIFPASITRQQVRESPSLDIDAPVSRQHERGYLGYYRYPYYWGGASLWGDGLYPSALALPGMTDAPAEAGQHDGRHLRSCNAVMSYDVHATDGDIGHVEGLLVDERTWAIKYLLVNTSNWWIGHEVLVAPEWIQDINWSASRVMVDLTRESIKSSPDYHSEVELNSEMESGMYKHYGKAGPWPKRSRHASLLATL